MTRREQALRAIQLSRKWTISSVATELGIKYYTLYSWLTGKRPPKKSNADVFDRVLALVGEEQALVMPVQLNASLPMVRIPVVGAAFAGSGEGYDLNDEIEVPLIFAHPDYRGWIAQGDSMADKIMPRDTVIVHAMDDARPGVVSLIRLGGETVLKRIKWTSDGWIMESHNPAYPPRPLPPDHQVCGFVVGWFRPEPGGGFDMSLDPTGRKFGTW
ncbi:MAG: XRE family transcriptional regulator [Fimbriimonadaceae bacterium]|nr:XRE family transcriptional regulator [Fimbriimonadaceae bacterium]